MSARKSIWTGIFSAFGMLVIILDTKTAIAGARDGIDLCISSVIPALFPLFILSALANTSLIGTKIPLLRHISTLCGVPRGCESLLLLGLIGGYPVGAQTVTEAYCSKNLNRKDAQRLLGFCNNAGPSFIFGILSGLFSSRATVWILWAVHILSALLTAMILPDKSTSSSSISQLNVISFPKALERSIKVLSIICGWVVIFRVLITFAQRWFLWLLSIESQCIFIGLLELTNGCCNLVFVTSEGLRFVLCCVFLAIGGVCVLAQTISVTKPLGLGMYIPGKLLQTIISLLLACIMQGVLYPEENAVSPLFPISAAVIGVAFTLLIHSKKSSSNMEISVV